MSDWTLLSGYRGCLLGLAVGDALGGPLEFMGREAIRIRFGEVREYLGGGWLHLRPGQGTDDTAMAQALAESLVALGEFQVRDVADRYVAWLATDPPDVGNTTRAALGYLAAGGDLAQASARAHELSEHKSAGNGSLMRCAPLALLYRARPDRLVDASAADARITHYDKLAVSASACFNLLVAESLREGADREGLVERASQAVRPYLDRVDDVLPGERDPHGPARFYDDEYTPPASGFVLNTLRAAVWAFNTTRSFEDCLVRAVNLGEDADTTGTVAGALAGAYYGAHRIPERWLARLEARSRMEWLAEQLYAKGGAA